jgi:flagellar biosynthesis protein FlhA
VFGQLGNYPRALFVAGLVMMVLALAPALPFLPFAILGAALTFVSYAIPKRRAEMKAAEDAIARTQEQRAQEEARHSVKESLRIIEVELCLGKQLSTAMMPNHGELAQRVAKMRRKFAEQYGFVVPEIKLVDDLAIPPKSYQIKIHGAVAATGELRVGDRLVLVGDGPVPDVPGDETREPAFGMKALWIPEMFSSAVRREGFVPIDTMSVLLTHLAEVIRSNLPQLLSYKDMRVLLDRLEPEYRRLLDEIIPTHISYSGLQAILRQLLAERISIRNLHLILEAIAESVPQMRRVEQIAEHVRTRLAPQICGDIAENGVLKVLRLGARWEMAFHQALRRDAKGEVVEFDIEPALLEQFAAEASTVIRGIMDQGQSFVLVVGPDVRPYIRMVMERMFATLPVLSHLEIARGIEIKPIGTIS